MSMFTRGQTARRLVRIATGGAVAASVVLLQVPAGATNDDPVGDLVKKVQQGVTQVTGSARSAAKSGAATHTSTSSDAPNPPASDSDSPGYETPNPTAPDHGSAYVNDTKVAGQPVLGVGSSSSSVDDHNNASSSTTLLALGGTALPLGQTEAHSTGNGSSDSDTFGPLFGPICDGSSGGVCLDVLYAHSDASKSGGHSRASSETGVLGACLGGSDPTGEYCDGVVDAGVLQSGSAIDRDLRTGRTRAGSGSQVADVCAFGSMAAFQPLGPGCGAGLTVAQSQGSADSGGHADRSSELLGLSLFGADVIPPQTDPGSVALPPGCDPTVLCLFANQGETYLRRGVAGHAQEALVARALPGLVDLTLAQSETLVHNAGSQATQPPRHPGSHTDKPGSGPQAGPGPAADVLPNTGGIWSGTLVLALMLVGLGCAVMAWNRRDELVRA